MNTNYTSPANAGTAKPPIATGKPSYTKALIATGKPSSAKPPIAIGKPSYAKALVVTGKPSSDKPPIATGKPSNASSTKTPIATGKPSNASSAKTPIATGKPSKASSTKKQDAAKAATATPSSIAFVITEATAGILGTANDDDKDNDNEDYIDREDEEEDDDDMDDQLCQVVQNKCTSPNDVVDTSNKRKYVATTTLNQATPISRKPKDAIVCRFFIITLLPTGRYKIASKHCFDADSETPSYVKYWEKVNASKC